MVEHLVQFGMWSNWKSGSVSGSSSVQQVASSSFPPGPWRKTWTQSSRFPSVVYVPSLSYRHEDVTVLPLGGPRPACPPGDIFQAACPSPKHLLGHWLRRGLFHFGARSHFWCVWPALSGLCHSVFRGQDTSASRRTMWNTKIIGHAALKGTPLVQGQSPSKSAASWALQQPLLSTHGTLPLLIVYNDIMQLNIYYNNVELKLNCFADVSTKIITSPLLDKYNKLY